MFANRLRLNFNTSFTGKDLLNIRLVSGSFPHPSRPDGGFSYGPDPFGAFLSFGGDFGGRTLEGQQTFNDIGNAPANNTVVLNKLGYTFPVGKQLRVAIMGVGAEPHEYVPSTFSFWDDDNGGNGSLSVLGQRNPIYGIGVGGGVGAGVGLSYAFNNQIELSAGYIGTSAADPSKATLANPLGGGLFNGRNVALAQLTLKPTDNLSLGLIYSRSQHPFGLPIFANDLGTTLANNPIYPLNQTLNVNAYGLSGLWKVTPKLALNAWFSYMDVQGSSGTSITGQNFKPGKADVLTYGVGIALPDLGKKGNLGGLVFGAAPYVTRSRIPSPLDQNPSFPDGLDALGTDNLLSLIPRRSVPWHFEVFYRHQLNDNISITPGLIWLLAPNQTNVNPDVLIGTIRVTFSF